MKKQPKKEINQEIQNLGNRIFLKKSGKLRLKH